MREVVPHSLRLTPLGQFVRECDDVVASYICAVHRGELEGLDRPKHLILGGSHRPLLLHVPINGVC
ncbi:hypothetical protein D3C72_2147330 [compost metagenome]